METFFIPNESDFRKWIKEAIDEYFQVRNVGDSKSNNDEPLLTRKEVAKRLGVSLVTLTDWVKRGLPSHKQRGKVYFLYSEVIEHIKETRPRKYFEIATA